ncbi:hypothetical protein Avbf_17223 [Armadillidium vulgare]|nr:hypothetical protein Avbf_17223 [Armadillidium vulgare]
MNFITFIKKLSSMISSSPKGNVENTEGLIPAKEEDVEDSSENISSTEDMEPFENLDDLLNSHDEADGNYIEEFSLRVPFNLRENFPVYHQRTGLNRYFKIASRRSQNQLSGYNSSLKDVRRRTRFQRKTFKHLAVQDEVGCIDDEEPFENVGDLNIPEEYDEIYAEEFNLSVPFNLRENFSVYRRKASLNKYFKNVSYRSQNQFLNGYHFALKDMTIHKRFHRKPFKHLAMQDLVEW